MTLFKNDVRPLGIFEDLPYELVFMIEEKRHRILMGPIFEVINKYVPRPEIQHYIDYYMAPVTLRYGSDEHNIYQLKLPHGMYFLGERTNGMTNIERRMINWTLDHRVFVRNTRNHNGMSMLREKKNESMLSQFDEGEIEDLHIKSGYIQGNIIR